MGCPAEAVRDRKIKQSKEVGIDGWSFRLHSQGRPLGGDLEQRPMEMKGEMHEG